MVSVQAALYILAVVLFVVAAVLVGDPSRRVFQLAVGVTVLAFSLPVVTR